MRKFTFSFKSLLVACLLMGGASSAWGQKANLTTDKGWSLMTEIPVNPNLYFFAVYDHTQDLGLVLGNGTSDKQGDSNKAMLYASSVNPETDKNALWTIAKNGDDIVFTCANYPEYMFQTEWQAYAKFHTSDNGGSFLFWGSLIPTYDAESGWTFASRHATDESQTDKYLGPWDGTVVAGDQIAANKGTSNLGHFDVYMIERGRYFQNVSSVSAGGSTVDASYLITNANATRRNLVGWEQTAGFYVREDQDWAINTYCFAIHTTGDPAPPISDCTFYQTISNLPAGRYTLTVTVPDWANSHSGAKLHANTAEVDMATEVNKLLTNTFDHDGGSLEYGIHILNSSSSLSFFPFDNFTLTAQYISNYAVNLSVGANDLVANKWYKLVVAEGKSFSISASVSISDISYTTVDQLEGANNSINIVNSETLLTSGTYYLKSSSAQTINFCVSATIGATGYTTFASSSPLNLSGMTASKGEVSAYVAKEKDASNVTLNSAPNDVKVGEGLVLKGTAGAIITIPVIASSTNTPDNLLLGCPTATEITTDMLASNDYYVVANNGGTAQFQKLANAITIPAGKACLRVAKSSVKALNIIFEDETATGVEAPVVVEAAEEDGVYYNLNGQVVTKDYKGIVIKNGKKYLNK